MPLEFGDIVLVPFPFTSQTASKKRPAIVISSRDYNASRPDVVIAAVTSQIRPAPKAGEVSVAEWRAAGLFKPSVIKPVLATVEQSLIIRKMGSLTAADVESLRNALALVLR
jgi:mRNA interferase MazF